MEGRKISADRSPSSLRQSLNNLQPMIHHIKDPPMTDSPKHDRGTLSVGRTLSMGGVYRWGDHKRRQRRKSAFLTWIQIGPGRSESTSKTLIFAAVAVCGPPTDKLPPSIRSSPPKGSPYHVLGNLSLVDLLCDGSLVGDY